MDSLKLGTEPIQDSITLIIDKAINKISHFLRKLLCVEDIAEQETSLL